MYMIQKEVGVDALDKQRPLKLQEVLKKLTRWQCARIAWQQRGQRLAKKAL